MTRGMAQLLGGYRTWTNIFRGRPPPLPGPLPLPPLCPDWSKISQKMAKIDSKSGKEIAGVPKNPEKKSEKKYGPLFLGDGAPHPRGLKKAQSGPFSTRQSPNLGQKSPPPMGSKVALYTPHPTPLDAPPHLTIASSDSGSDDPLRAADDPPHRLAPDMATRFVIPLLAARPLPEAQVDSPLSGGSSKMHAFPSPSWC